MDSDRHFKSKRDDRKKDRKKKSHSKSSGSRSRSSSRSSSYVRKKKGKKSTHDGNDKYSRKDRESREEMPNEEEYRRNMMGFQGYPMMFDGKMKQGFGMENHMMSFGGMRGGFPPGFPMPGYHPMFRPPMFPPGIPPMPNNNNNMDMSPMQKMNRMGVKTFMDPKAVPLTKKDKEKTVKKEEENGKILDFPQPMHTAEIFKSLQLSVKHAQEPLLLFTAKNVLTDVENKLREKKLKGRAKEVSEYLSGVYDKVKEIEKKDKKKSTTSTSTETSKISELDVVKALNETEDIKAFLSLVNLEKFSLDSFYEPDIIHVKESEESAMLFEEVKSLFLSSKDVTSQNV